MSGLIRTRCHTALASFRANHVIVRTTLAGTVLLVVACTSQNAPTAPTAAARIGQSAHAGHDDISAAHDDPAPSVSIIRR